MTKLSIQISNQLCRRLLHEDKSTEVGLSVVRQLRFRSRRRYPWTNYASSCTRISSSSRLPTSSRSRLRAILRILTRSASWPSKDRCRGDGQHGGEQIGRSIMLSRGGSLRRDDSTCAILFGKRLGRIVTDGIGLEGGVRRSSSKDGQQHLSALVWVSDLRCGPALMSSVSAFPWVRNRW